MNYENRFAYDNNQNLILEKYQIENDSTFTEIRNTYHKNGKLKESIRTPKGSDFFVISTQKFNNNGDLIEDVVKTSDGITDDIWEYKLKYDSENNWIEKIEFKDSKPLRILKRTIEYYK